MRGPEGALARQRAGATRQNVRSAADRRA